MFSEKFENRSVKFRSITTKAGTNMFRPFT